MDAPLFMADRLGLQTEFYQLVQSAVYHADGMWGEATFDLYVKELPRDHGFLVVAGIEPAIQAVLAARFSEEEIEWVRQHPTFHSINPRFFDWMANFRFSGEIAAVPEGTVVHHGEPILRVTAPLGQAGLLETRLVQTVTHASAVATRAARIVEAARGRPVIDFGSRRSPGGASAWGAARAAWIGGSAATTNAMAAQTLGIPAWGVMSDSLLAACDEESLAYAAVCQHFPGFCHVNLPDEDLHEGVRKLVGLGDHVPSVRVDHQNLAMASRVVRQSLDRYKLNHVKILGSGSLRANEIERLVAVDAPVDLFGVGAALAAGDAEGKPKLSYRISEMFQGPDPLPVSSHWSSPWPGRKQVMRMVEHDVICLDVEVPTFQAAGGQALLELRVQDGALVGPTPSLEQMRERRAAGMARLPTLVREVPARSAWPVRPSDALSELVTRI